MIKKLLLCVMFFKAVPFITAQNFTAKYNFSNVTGSGGSCSNCTVDPTPPPVVSGLYFSPFSAVGTGTMPNAAYRWSFQGWPNGAANGVDNYSSYSGSLKVTSYYEVNITPQSGYALELTDLTFGVRRSGTGIRNYAVRSSLDGFSNNLTASVGTNTDLSVVSGNIFFWNFDATSTAADLVGSEIIPGAAFSAIYGPVTFRFYGWNSENNQTGTFSIDSVVFTGRVFTSPLGIQNLSSSANDLQVFPNPCKDLLTLQHSAAYTRVDIYNSLGQLTYQKNNETKNDALQLELSALPRGMYIVKATAGHVTRTGKLVLEE